MEEVGERDEAEGEVADRERGLEAGEMPPATEYDLVEGPSGGGGRRSGNGRRWLVSAIVLSLTINASSLYLFGHR